MHSSSSHRASIGFAVAAAALALPAAAAWAGPVQILSTDGSLEIRVDPARGEETVTETATVTATESFSEEVTADVALDGFTVNARTSVDAVYDDGFTFAGVLQYEATDTRDQESPIPEVDIVQIFNVTFSIDEAYDYDFRRSGVRNDEYAFNERELQTFLSGVDDNFDTVEPGPTGRTGTLQPGRYRLSFEEVNYALIGPTAELDAEYLVSLGLTRSADDDGGGATPIPLPPAAWAGLGTFACYGASRLLGRRLRQA